MKVYIVFIQDDSYCGNGFLERVFDSREKAEAYIKYLDDPYKQLYIEECEVL